MASKERGRIPPDAGVPSQLQQIIAALTEGVIIVDPDGSSLWADETALSLYGVRNLRELGGTAAGFAERYQLSYRNQQKLRPDKYPFQRLLRGETIEKAQVEVTCRFDGKRWFHQIRTMALNDPGGQPDLVLIVDDRRSDLMPRSGSSAPSRLTLAPAIIARLADMRYVKVNHG